MTIKAGDLARLVADHGCSKGLGAAGYIVKIDRVFPPRPVACSNCGVVVLVQASFHISDAGTHSAPLSWLRRIPPLEELDDVDHDEEITA